ncbi:MAG: rubrerythrin [Solirubrobacterales bacterium]|nr:rubrerythrin [Solirubrobacterales bacterium]
MTLTEDTPGTKAPRSDDPAIIEMLAKAYWMEIETVMNYLANSINPDGVLAQQVAASLRDEVQDELDHARRFGERIKELYGVVPTSEDFRPEQDFLAPPAEQTDVVHVIKGVIQAESEAVKYYREIVDRTEHADPVTNDMVIEILHDEQRHRRLFEGFLREYEAERRN